MNSSNRDERSDGSKTGTSGLHASSLQIERKRKNSCSEIAQLKWQKKIDSQWTSSLNRDKRSDGSKAGTSGLHALNLQKQRKRKNSCSEVAQLKQQKEIDSQWTRSNDEESQPGNDLTKILEMPEDYVAYGLKSSLHGVAYQLKLLMLFLKRGIDQEYSFRLATEMDAAEKFDDLVFQYEDGEKIAHRFLQAKHKRNEAEKISIKDLLTDTDKKLNLQKYFLSYRKIKRNPKFNSMHNEIKDIILCTNIGFKWDDKLRALTLSEGIFDTERDETILKTGLRRFKEKFIGQEEIVSVLEYASDLMTLAKNLAGRALVGKFTKMNKAEQERSDDCFKLYQFALLKEVIDGSSKKLYPKFINPEGLSPEAENFRQAIVKVFYDQRKTYNLHTDPVIKDLDVFAQEVATLIKKGKVSRIIEINKRKNVIKENFDKLAGYVLVKKDGKIRFSLAFLNNDELPGNLDDFREKLLDELSNKNITPNDISGYTFQVYKDFQTCDEIHVDEEIFWKIIGEKEFDLSDNFCKFDANLESVGKFVENLAHLIKESRSNGEPKVKIKKENDKIFENMIKLANCKYRALIEADDGIRFRSEFLTDTQLPDNLEKFRNGLKAQEVKDLVELRFVINNFPRTKLPTDSVTDINSEIKSFLDKLVFAVNQPNEVELGNIIAAEMGKCRGINLIDSDFIADRFQRYVFDWMKYKEGRFLTRADGQKFFDKMAKNLTSLQLTWQTQELFVRMQDLKIRFIKDEMELLEFLEPENETQLFILSSMPNTILGLIQVHQILKKIPHYQKDDGYIFLGLNSFLLMQGPVVKAFASRSEHLLIIECKSIEVNEQASYTESLKAMTSNKLKKIILITEKDGTPVDQFKRIFRNRFVEKKVEVNSLLDLDDESRKKLIKERSLKFQGQEVPLSTLIINKESMNLINAEALARLINNETLEIGKCLEDLGDVENYYISRTLQRPKINQFFLKDKSRFYVTTNNQLSNFDPQRNQDIVVISDNGKLFKELAHDKNYKTHNIHWLKSEQREFIWQESNGTVSNFRNFVYSDSVESFSPEKVTDISNKITIIAAQPGMGKSTMLTHLSVQTKISEPTVWVAKVNLSVDCSKKLKEMDSGIEFDDEKTIDFLLTSAKLTSEMPEYQFFNYCYKTGNMILLFDGFDEISPDYTNKVIKLLKFLKSTRVKKIWVTTRPYNIKNKMESELGSFSYMLEEFSEPDQRHFLMKFWATKLNSDNFDHQRANVFIDVLLKSFSKSINDSQKKFISIPLQIRMIADVCQGTFRNFNEPNEENIAGLEKKLEENLELMCLYNNFFEVKFRDILLGEKQPDLNAAISVSRGMMDREREHVVETHEILALENFYPNNSFIPREKVIRSLRNIKRCENKTGIIDCVIDDKPVFVHKSFAEYFVALWFSKNWRQENVKQHLKKCIFSQDSEVIRNFFDRILAKNELETSESQEFSTEHPESANVYKLHNAVLNDDKSGFQKLLDDVESLFYKTDAAGRNLLHLVAARGNEGIARSFLEAVLKRTDHKVVTDLLSDKDELFQWTPMTYADRCDHWNVAELFLQTGATGEDMFEAISNIKSFGRFGHTVLHKAAIKGYLKIAEFLSEKGAIIDARNVVGENPLHSAAKAGHLQIVQYFISQQEANFEATSGSGRTALHAAAENGNLELVKYLIDEKKANLEAVTKSGYTVLQLAAENGNLKLVKYLVDEKKANFDSVTKLGCAVLHLAALRGNLEIVKYLVDEKKANFQTADESGHTVLHLAALKRNAELVKYLVDEKKANFEAADQSGRTVLHVAAGNKDLELVKYLVDEKKANFEAVDKARRTVLHVAADNNDLELVKYLVDEKKANFEAVTKSGCTVLHVAALKGNLELVKYLVDEEKANFEAADESGHTVLHVAALKGNLKLVKYLVDEKKANFEAADESGCTVLYLAALKGNLEVVKYLVDEKKANFEAADESGYTVLHVAALKGNLELVKYLVDEKKANFEAVAKSGCTVLHVAALKRNLELVKYLVDEKKANFKAADKAGRTVLYVAADNKDLELVKYLIDEKKANFEAVTKSGRTVLHVAALKGSLELVKYLVDEKKANFQAADESGCTVLHLAALKGNLEVVKYFVDEKKANFEAADESGRTVLHVAALKGNLELVKYLVDTKKANFEITNKFGCTPMNMADFKGNSDVVKYFVDVKNGKNANFESGNGLV